jgi:hypothetical protein
MTDMTGETEFDTEHAVPPEEARASQFYVTRVTTSPPENGADVGDMELNLTDVYFTEGDTRTSKTFGGRVRPKKWEIVAGPFDCPPFPHVLALEAWFNDAKPEDAWEAYTEGKQ